jgi:hypothetical protein
MLLEYNRVAACRATIIPLEPCALNVEIQHLLIPLKEGLGGERRLKDSVKTRVTVQISLHV